MAKITYIEHSGAVHTAEVAPGNSVMAGAVKNDIPGILADCGGTCSCGTCKVFVDEAWAGKLPARQESELDMLNIEPDEQPNLRLSCQIEVTEALDGLVVRLPESQF